MPVRAKYHWDYETKPIAPNERYRYSFDQTCRLGRQVSIDLSPNLLFRKIGIDRPFTTLLFPTIVVDRSFTIILFRMIGIGTQTFAILLYECWRANAIEDSPSRYSQLYFDSSSSMPHAPPAQQRILEYGAVRPCCGWSQQQGGDHFLCVFDAKLKPAVFRATCLCAAQFLLIPWTIPYRISYWPNNRSAIMRIDTYLSRGTIARLRGVL